MPSDMIVVHFEQILESKIISISILFYFHLNFPVDLYSNRNESFAPDRSKQASKQASRNPLLHRLLSLIELPSVLVELSFGLPGPS